VREPRKKRLKVRRACGRHSRGIAAPHARLVAAGSVSYLRPSWSHLSRNSVHATARWSGVCAMALGAAPSRGYAHAAPYESEGDAMAHAILPGAAVGYLVAGLRMFAMRRVG